MQYRSIVKSTVVIGIFVIVSRVLGLVREMLFAYLFGTTTVKSAFDIAFQIPNLFRRLFGEGALSGSFIPAFTESLKNEGREKAWCLAGRVISMLAVFLALVIIAGIAGVSAWLWLAAPSAKTLLMLDLLRIMLPYALLICLAAVSMGILNSFNHFATPAATPVLLNVFMIMTMLWVCPRVGPEREAQIYWVAWAVIVAGVVQLACQLPVLMRFGYRPALSFEWSDPRIRRILVLMVPVALGMGVTQINYIVGRQLAFYTADWATAALTYAEVVVYLPHGLFATSLGTVLLPAFSQYSADADFGRITATIGRALRHLMFIMVPASVGLIVLAVPIVSLIYEHGRFTAESTVLTARALRCYAPGLVAFSLCKVFVPAFYALKDTSTPVRIGLCTVFLSFCLNVAGLTFLPLYYKHTGVALGTVIAEAINGVVLAWLLTRRIGSPGWLGIFGYCARLLVAALVMGAAVYFSYGFLSAYFAGHGLTGKGLLGAGVFCSIGIGVLVYVVGAVFLCRAEFVEVVSLLRARRLQKKS